MTYPPDVYSLSLLCHVFLRDKMDKVSTIEETIVIRYNEYAVFTSIGEILWKEVISMDYILVNIVAPIIVGVVLALFSHWLDQRKS